MRAIWNRRSQRSSATGTPLLPAYTREGWVRRHRGLALSILFGVTFIYAALFLLIGRFLMVQFLAPFVLLLLLIIWALPDRNTVPDQWLVHLFFVFMGAMMIWPDYLALTLPGMPWITAARLVGGPMVLVMLICLSQSSRFRGEMKSLLDINPLISKFLLTYVVLSVLSVGISDKPFESVNLLVVGMVNWVALFLVALFAFSRPGNVERFIWLLWFAVLFWCVVGGVEWYYSKVPWANHIPSFLKVEGELIERVLAGSARSATGVYRVQGKYTTPLSFAEFMALATPFILHITLSARLLALRAAAAMTLVMMFLIIGATDSRLGVVGFLLSFLFYLLAWGTRRWQQDRASLLAPAVTLAYPAVFAGFIVSTFFVGRLRNMVWGSGAEATSDDARFTQIDMGMKDILNQPWGYGFGRAAETLGFTGGGDFLTIDNYFLSVALDLGVIGFIAYFGMFVVAIVLGSRSMLEVQDDRRQWLVPATISLTNFIIIKSVLSQQEGHSLAFAVLAMVVALLGMEKTGVGRGSPSRSLSTV